MTKTHLDSVAPDSIPSSLLNSAVILKDFLDPSISSVPLRLDVSADMFLIGMLMSQFTITGFDACAHM